MTWLTVQLATCASRDQMVSVVPLATRADGVDGGPKATVAVPDGGGASSCHAAPGPSATTRLSSPDGAFMRTKRLLRPAGPKDTTCSSLSARGFEIAQRPPEPDQAATRSVSVPLTTARRP